MSHFSDIGFYLENEDDMYALAEQVYPLTEMYKSPQGTYFGYADPSGAELWLQLNAQNELIGMNPHFSGGSSLRVGITAMLPHEDSELDASLHLWADPQDSRKPESGQYPMIVDVPDYFARSMPSLPWVTRLHITAFAEELQLFENEEAYYAWQAQEDFKMAAQSFVPIGLFASGGEEHVSPQAHARINGKIKTAEKRLNTITKEHFFYFQIESFGGLYDAVADARQWPELPPVGGIVSGQFWLSARLPEAPPQAEAPKRRKLREFLGNIFGRKGR